MSDGQPPNGWGGLCIQALRAPFFVATVAAVLVGSAVAWNDGNFRWDLFVITLVAALAIHGGTNVLNDYYDHVRGADELQEYPTPYSGGSRVIQERRLSPTMVLWLAVACYGVALAGCLWLVSIRGWWLAVIVLIGLVISVEYSAPPLKLAYRGHGLGELSSGLGLGPVMIVGTYFVQTGAIRPSVVWASLPMGFLFAATLYINEFPDCEVDRVARKQTLVVVQGRREAIPAYLSIMMAPYLCVLVGVIAGLMPWMAFLTYFTLPLALRAMKIARRHYDNTPDLLPANAATVQVHSLFALALATSFLLDRVFRLWL